MNFTEDNDYVYYNSALIEDPYNASEWVTKYGQRIPYDELEDTHLANIYAQLLRKVGEGSPQMEGIRREMTKRLLADAGFDVEDLDLDLWHEEDYTSFVKELRAELYPDSDQESADAEEDWPANALGLVLEYRGRGENGGYEHKVRFRGSQVLVLELQYRLAIGAAVYPVALQGAPL